MHAWVAGEPNELVVIELEQLGCRQPEHLAQHERERRGHAGIGHEQVRAREIGLDVFLRVARVALGIRDDEGEHGRRAAVELFVDQPVAILVATVACALERSRHGWAAAGATVERAGCVLWLHLDTARGVRASQRQTLGAQGAAVGAHGTSGLAGHEHVALAARGAAAAQLCRDGRDAQRTLVAQRAAQSSRGTVDLAWVSGHAQLHGVAFAAALDGIAAGRARLGLTGALTTQPRPALVVFVFQVAAAID